MNDPIEELALLMREGKTVALTGAGISTESGIPDYRGPETRHRAKNPIQHRDFVRDPNVRRRYWARAFVGWQRFSAARPNDGHRALAELEQRGLVSGIVTQNVDRLHQGAGSRSVVELHGALAEVICLGCGSLESREDVQHRLLLSNPDFAAEGAKIAPDGDAELDRDLVEGFRVPECLACEGPLKPHVVFFGGTVEKEIVEAAFSFVDRAQTLLVLGTSLAVYSGFRFVRRARERGLRIALVNLGETRADEIADLRIDAPLGTVLPDLAARLL